MEKGARIVNVASGAHKAGRIHFDDINLKHGYNVVKAYSQSKLANSSKRSKDTELAWKLFELSENIVSK